MTSLCHWGAPVCLIWAQGAYFPGGVGSRTKGPAAGWECEGSLDTSALGVVRVELHRTAKTGTGQVLTTRQPTARGLRFLTLSKAPTPTIALPILLYTPSGAFGDFAPSLGLDTGYVLSIVVIILVILTINESAWSLEPAHQS